jgi:hypothetical protein
VFYIDRCVQDRFLVSLIDRFEDCPVVGSSCVGIPDRDREKFEELLAGRWASACDKCGGWKRIYSCNSWDFPFGVNKEATEIPVLLTRSLFACDILRRFLRRVSLVKPPSAPLRF